MNLHVITDRREYVPPPDAKASVKGGYTFVKTEDKLVPGAKRCIEVEAYEAEEQAKRFPAKKFFTFYGFVLLAASVSSFISAKRYS